MLHKEKGTFRLTKTVHSIMQQVFFEGKRKSKALLEKKFYFHSTNDLQLFTKFCKTTSLKSLALESICL